ncbi:MAG: universal stress protein, partial [Myxococcales bacterium]|nr:universal stress protein [Myxococcales bacterium]
PTRDVEIPIESFREWLQAAAEKEVARVGARDAFEDIDTVRATTAEDVLATAVTDKRADGLILGRKTPRGQDAVVRLGRVARRLIRRAESPMIVVPPDLQVADVGEGPVVVATDLGDDAVGALHFGQAMAKALGRELVLAYGIRLPNLLDQYLPSDAWNTVQSAIGREGGESARAWAARHGVEARVHIVDGPLVRGLWMAAFHEHACLLVAGSRRLSMLDRIFTSSIGTELAAASPLPVAIVPPAKQT